MSTSTVNSTEAERKYDWELKRMVTYDEVLEAYKGKFSRKCITRYWKTFCLAAPPSPYAITTPNEGVWEQTVVDPESQSLALVPVPDLALVPSPQEQTLSASSSSQLPHELPPPEPAPRFNEKPWFNEKKTNKRRKRGEGMDGEGLCITGCGRPNAIDSNGTIFDHCCRTCRDSGGRYHGPLCEEACQKRHM